MKSETKNMSVFSVAKAVWYFLESDKIKFTTYFAILSIVLFYVLVPPYIVGKIVDFFNSYSKGESLRTFYLYLAFLGASYVLASLIRTYSKQVIVVIGQKLRARARVLGFQRLTEFSLEWHSKENTGNKLQRIFTGADSLKKGIEIFAGQALGWIISILGSLVFFIFTHWIVAVVCIVYIFIYFLLEFIFGKKLLNLSNEFNKLNQSAGGIYVESTTNMLAIKALGSEKGIRTRVTNKEEQARDISIVREKIFFTKWFFFQFVNGAAMVLMLYFLGLGVLENVLSVGMILVFFTYIIKIRDSLGDLSDFNTHLLDIRSGVGNMMPIFWETDFIKRGNERFPKDWDKIEIKDGVMNYGSGQMGLENLNLTLKRNTKTGVAGLSGSGKSTLAKIILGLYALKGGKFKIGNKDYYSISHNETLSHITVVLQETELFNLSLRDNITMMRGEDTELLNQAVEISQLKEVIDRLPDGLDSLIGEKGYMLSGGERQRLGIARAIYKNSEIIILDEATSSLDSETESRIMAGLLGEYGNDKTFLIIAHRLGTLRYTDNIAVMERGEVVEEGTYMQLMNNSKSVFYRMNYVRGREGSQRDPASNVMNQTNKDEESKKENAKRE